MGRGAGKNALDALGFPTDLAPRDPYIKAISKLGSVLKTPWDLLQAASFSAEAGPRLAAYRATLEGAGDVLAAEKAYQDITVNFSKSGEFFKSFGMLMPLVNARLQGTLRSADAFRDDPTGFTHRLTIGSAIPAAGLYAYNRMLYGDLYDDVPQSIKDRNFVVGYGTILDNRDPKNKERLLYHLIPKTETTALVANPLEHLLDTVFHVKHGEVALDDFQRTERSAGQMWLAQLAQMVPIHQEGNTLFEPSAWLTGALDMNPAVGTIVQMWANHDDFLDRPIVPEDQMILPAQYRRGVNGKESPVAARALSALTKAAGLPIQLSPPEIAFAVNHLGGTAGTQLLGSLDKVWDAFGAAGFPLPQFRATTIDDLQIPKGLDPETYQQYVDAQNQVDFRPWQMRLLEQVMGSSRFEGMTGTGPSATSKADMLSVPERNTWRETMAMDQALKTARAETQRKIEDVYNDSRTDFSFSERYDAISKLQEEARGRREQIAKDHPRALQTPQDRDAFMSTLPGVPLNVDKLRPPNLDPNVPVEQLVFRYNNPSGIVMETLNQQQQLDAKTTELTKMAHELNVPQSTLRDYIAAASLNNKLPSIPVPAVWLDHLVDDYLNPPGAYNPLDATEVGAARRNVVDQRATEWLPPGADIKQFRQDLLERVQTRLVTLSDNNPMSLSRERALQLYSQIKQQPEFVDPQGNALGIPQEWEGWKADIDFWRAKYPGKPEMWPTYVRVQAEAQANARTAQQATLFADPAYYDYQQWFGFGRNLSPSSWRDFMSGANPRYSDNPGNAESARRDGIIRQYNTLPAGQQKNMLRTEAGRYKKMLVPGWEAAMRRDDFGLDYSQEML